MTQDLRSCFSLNPGITFLNHGSYGAVPNVVVGEMMDAEAADIVGVTNASYALTAAVRSLPFCAGDEIVVTNHEYGAVMKLLDLMRREHGIVVKVVDIPADLADEQTFVDRITDAFSENTKAVLMSVITSQTALCSPVR